MKMWRTWRTWNFVEKLFPREMKKVTATFLVLAGPLSYSTWKIVFGQNFMYVFLRFFIYFCVKSTFWVGHALKEKWISLSSLRSAAIFSKKRYLYKKNSAKSKMYVTFCLILWRTPIFSLSPKMNFWPFQIYLKKGDRNTFFLFWSVQKKPKNLNNSSIFNSLFLKMTYS